MTDWIVWAVLGGVLVTLEMFTGTFYLLMIAIGFAAGALAGWLGAPRNMQFILAAMVGAAATYALRRSKLGRVESTNAARDPNVNLDVGQTLAIEQWKNTGGHYSGRAMYRGALWDVELEQGGMAEAGRFVIREVRGSRLIVANA
jgi:membrane protein implicated in regulation of membrane protease activity